MAFANYSLPPAARCERPSQAFSNEEFVHVGGLAQGPDENRGFSGRDAGLIVAIDAILSDMRPSLGKGVPLQRLSSDLECYNSKKHRFFTQLYC